MNAIDRLEAKLVNHPELTWQREGDRIKIEAPLPRGFAVEFHFSGDESTVYLGEVGWHQHFLEETEALDFVAWCYSGEVRLREIRRGSTVVRSVLEARIGDSWSQAGEVGCLLPVLWGKKTEVIFQNPNLLSSPPTEPAPS